MTAFNASLQGTDLLLSCYSHLATMSVVGQGQKVTLRKSNPLFDSSFLLRGITALTGPRLEDPANEQILEIRILLILSPAHSMHSMYSNEEKDVELRLKSSCSKLVGRWLGHFLSNWTSM